VNILASVRDYIDALVHPTARQDVFAAARHRAFIAARLLGCSAALAAFPVYLTLRGTLSAFETAIFGWLIVPILIAYFLSRTGRYQSAHILSSLALTVLVTAVAFQTGGLASFAAAWLVIVPLEAALSASRRVIAAAALFALGATALLLALNTAELLPEAALAQASMPGALGFVAALLYASGIGFHEALVRGSPGPRPAQDDGYQLLARHMTDVISRHGRHGAVLSISASAEPLLGVRAHDLLGHGLFDRVHVADRPAYLTALADAATDGAETAVDFRLRREAPDRKRPHDINFVWVEMRCRPLDMAGREAADRAREVVAVLRDISLRKAQEETLANVRAEAERSSLAKSRFVATMSHELRTPLNVVIGFSEMLTRQDPVIEPARQQEYARLINDAGHHLLSIVNGLLDISKIEAGSCKIAQEPFKLSEVVAGCCGLMALKASQAGIVLRQRVADDMPDIVADKRAVNQMLLNLLSNAIKFTERGGSVSVRASSHGGCAVLEVEDNGIGVDADDVRRLGEPFFQARASHDRQQQGTGLGLSIVKGLVKLHRGELDIRSRLGKGTCVIVRLPSIEAPLRKTEPPRALPARILPRSTTADHRVKKIA
jgi:two-component system, cell cycle sensor histidine kinase DivJ